MTRHNVNKWAPPQTGGARGFSLIELMITLLVLAIIVAVAVPSYSNYVRKSRRADAKSALLDLAALEERYYSTQNVYSSTATDFGYGAWPATVGSGYYSVAQPTITAATAPTASTPAGTPASYTFVATPLAGTDQVKDTACASFTVSSGGVQSALNSAGVDNTATCWH